MNQISNGGFLGKNFKLIIFYVVFAVVQFYFFWGLCHLMPGERYYQRKARIRAGNPPPAPISNAITRSQAANFETESSHARQILDDLRRSGHLAENSNSN